MGVGDDESGGIIDNAGPDGLHLPLQRREIKEIEEGKAKGIASADELGLDDVDAHDGRLDSLNGGRDGIVAGGDIGLVDRQSGFGRADAIDQDEADAGIDDQDGDQQNKDGSGFHGLLLVWGRVNSEQRSDQIR